MSRSISLGASPTSDCTIQANSSLPRASRTGTSALWSHSFATSTDTTTGTGSGAGGSGRSWRAGARATAASTSSVAGAVTRRVGMSALPGV